MRLRPASRTAALLLVALAAAHPRLAAQGERGRGTRTPPPARTAREALRHLLASLRGEERTDPSAFFPRDGEWTWVHTTHLSPGGEIVGVRRFRAADTERAIYGCGPARDSFYASYEGQPPGLTDAATQVGPWRRVRGERFVLRRSHTFVEWRRENGRWVISSFGDESERGPDVVGTVVGDVMRERHLPPPATPAYAAGARWLVGQEVLQFEGYRYVPYGRPRMLEPAELETIGWRENIRIYVEKGHVRDPGPAVLYVPVSADDYQPYINYAPDDCPSGDRP